MKRFFVPVSLLVLTGCGTQAHPSHPDAVTPPDSVVITRSYGGNQTSFTFDSSIALKLSQDIENLSNPVPSNVTINCPSDNGMSYELKFSSHGHVVMDVHADASGCQFVSVGNTGYWGSTELWKDLGADLQMTSGALHGSFAQPGGDRAEQGKFVPIEHPVRIVVAKNGGRKTITDPSIIKTLVAKINQAGEATVHNDPTDTGCHAMTRDNIEMDVFESDGRVRVFENHGGGCWGLLDDQSGRMLPTQGVLSDKNVM